MFTVHLIMVVRYLFFLQNRTLFEGTGQIIMAIIFVVLIFLTALAFFKGLILMSSDKDVWKDSPAGIKEAALQASQAAPPGAASRPGYMASDKASTDVPHGLEDDKKEDVMSPAGNNTGWKPYQYV